MHCRAAAAAADAATYVAAGLRGVKRVKGVRNTINDSKAPRPLGKVNRQFRAAGANQRCVSDFT